MENLTVEKQLREFLMSSEGFVTLEEARKELSKKNKQKTINEIKDVLRRVGKAEFE